MYIRVLKYFETNIHNLQPGTILELVDEYAIPAVARGDAVEVTKETAIADRAGVSPKIQALRKRVGRPAKAPTAEKDN